MAKLHNMISRGNWSDALKRALGVTKSEGGVERFGETMTPVVDLWELGEWAYLRGEILWTSRRLNAGPIAAESSIVAVVNPTTSKQLLVVDGAHASMTGSSINCGLVDRATLAATLTLGNPPVARDLRWSDNQLGSTLKQVNLEVWQGTDATVPINDRLETVQNSGLVADFRTPPYIVKPGFGFFLQAETVNILMLATIWGRVRPALVGEL